MRPHKLELTAIGSFAGQIEIDFDALSAYGLFHVHGATGAGKSSLLDGLCFALYGKVPEPRRADALRSHHADPRTESCAALEFTAQGVDYRIVRTPAQTRAKLRSKGVTEQRAMATLHRRYGTSWKPVASGPKEVDPIVHEVIGLTAEQFMQVVVLPQGNFQRALRASDKERAELFRTLFHSERFERYGEILKQRSDALQRNVSMRSAKARGIVEQARDRATSLDIAVNWPETITVDDGDSEGLSAAAKQMRRTASEHQQALTAIQHDRDAAEMALREAELQVERHKQKRAAESELAQIEGKDAEIASLRKELEDAERVVALTPLLERLEEHVLKRELTARKRDACQQRLKAQLSLLPAIADDFRSLVEIVSRDKPSTSQLKTAESRGRDLLARLHSFADQTKQAIRARADEARDRKSVVETERHINACLEKASDAVKHLDALRAERDMALRSAERLAQLTAEVERLARQLNAAKELQRLSVELDAKTASVIEAETRANQARKAHLDLLEQRLNGMAAELASQLVDGEPCAVCGSKSHPLPATASHETVSVKHVSDAAAVADRAGAEVDTVRQEVQSLRDKAQSLSILAAGAIDDLSKARSDHQAAEAALADANEASNRLSTLNAKINEAEVANNVAVQRVEEHRSRAIHLLATADVASLRAAALEAEVQEALGEECDIHAAHASVGGVVDTLMELSRIAQEESAAWDVASEDAHSFNTALAEAGIADVATVKSCARSESHRRELRRRIESHGQAKAAAISVLSNPDVRNAVSVEDIDLLKEHLRELTLACDDGLKKCAWLDHEANELTRLAGAFAKELSALQPLREEAERVTRLADLCRGVGPNEKRMSLERYVLAAFLEEVAAAANTRLRAMTSDRYTLRHTDAPARNNAASGLGLVVSDAYTGVEREVSTLSGGETFLASMSLALGLADVVQAHAGGVRVETLFIDEGFGSLDVDTLDLAMIQLDRLREGGRLVGIISHIPVLRERIPSGIEVVSAPSGSTLRMTNVPERLSA